MQMSHNQCKPPEATELKKITYRKIMLSAYARTSQANFASGLEGCKV